MFRKSGSSIIKVLINSITDSKTNINGEYRSSKINSIDKISRNYSDLENVIASRYEELTRRKETNS